MTGEGNLSDLRSVNTNVPIGTMTVPEFLSCILQFTNGSFGGMNLDNSMSNEVVSPNEGEDDMASKFRATYTYTDAQGIPHTIRLNGQSKQDTDLQFQQFLSQCSGFDGS